MQSQPSWNWPVGIRYCPKKLLTRSIVNNILPGISIYWWFLFWQVSAPSLARGAVVLRSLPGATSLRGISGDNKALCGGVSPSGKEFRLCSRPQLSSLTNVQLIVCDTGADKAFSECFLSLNKSTVAQADHINWQITCTLQGKSGGNYAFLRKLRGFIWLLLALAMQILLLNCWKSMIHLVCQDTHRGEELPVSSLQQAVYALRSPQVATPT